MGLRDKVTGRVKQAVGDLTGSEATRREGLRDERRANAKDELAREEERSEQQRARTEHKAEEVAHLEHDPESEHLPIRDYDRLNAEEVNERLVGLSPPELDRVADYERRHQNRKTVLDRIDAQRI
jgi:uncharacterized protein YjbJ (UPF0337 family)